MPTLNTLKILAPLAVVASLAISPAFGTTKVRLAKSSRANRHGRSARQSSTSGSGGIRPSRGMPQAARA